MQVPLVMLHHGQKFSVNKFGMTEDMIEHLLLEVMSRRIVVRRNLKRLSVFMQLTVRLQIIGAYRAAFPVQALEGGGNVVLCLHFLNQSETNVKRREITDFSTAIVVLQKDYSINTIAKSYRNG